MNAPPEPLTRDDVAFSSGQFLRLLESIGLTGTWSWRFAGDEHRWTAGLFRILGLEPGDLRPGYESFVSLIHPADRMAFSSAAQIRQQGLVRDATFRVIRPNGSLRTLTSRGEIYLAPDGRPRSAAWSVLDVTDRDLLARAQARQARLRRATFERTRSWMHASRYTPSHRVASAELLQLTGLTQAEFRDDWARGLVRQDRAHMRVFVRSRIEAGAPFIADTRFLLAEGGHGLFRGVFVPVRGTCGRVESWTTLSFPRGRPPGLAVTGALRRGLEESLSGRHLHAARALLDWSMTDLARASGLSVSTIRRLEADGGAAAARSRHAAVAALRANGVVFGLLPTGTIAVGRA
ncbi:PAS domain-containing protein [Methylobacterium oryzisoli]|uniref:PAS domain-containing protein n=1 Tax=Methylobacterium oryzisoli TaxID=3385502 RepID=UPI0038918FD5